MGIAHVSEQLDELIKEQQYSNKLLETLVDLFSSKGAESVGMKQSVNAQIDLMEKVILSNPALSQKPEQVELVKEILNRARLNGGGA